MIIASILIVVLRFYWKIIVCYFTTIFAMLNWSVVSTITSRCRGSYPSYLSILLVGWCASSPDIRVISTPDWATIIMMWSLLYHNGYVISWLVHLLEHVITFKICIILTSASLSLSSHWWLSVAKCWKSRTLLEGNEMYFIQGVW